MTILLRHAIIFFVGFILVAAVSSASLRRKGQEKQRRSPKLSFTRSTGTTVPQDYGPGALLTSDEINKFFGSSVDDDIADTDTEMFDEKIPRARGGGIARSNDLIYFDDEILAKGQFERLYGNQIGDLHKRNALLAPSQYWPKGVIPYEIQSSHVLKKESTKRLIYQAMADWQSKTCITFQPATKELAESLGHENSIMIDREKGGCSSHVGMRSPSQSLKLSYACMQIKSRIIHELGHAIGLYHEQSRPDRDDYVTINVQNIKPKQIFAFDKYLKDFITISGKKINTDTEIPYDYYSIMQYGRDYFSKNHLPTIITKDPKFQNIIGEAKTASYLDAKLVSLMYNCAGHCNNPPSFCKEGYVGKDCKCISDMEKWGEWSSWTECVVTCETGIQTRQRRCQNSTSDRECFGRKTEEKHCSSTRSSSPCAVTCDRLNLTDGTVRYSHDDRSYGSIATYLCNEGLELIGSATHKCENDGWSGFAPDCVTEKCYKCLVWEKFFINKIVQRLTPYGSSLSVLCSLVLDDIDRKVCHNKIPPYCIADSDMVWIIGSKLQEIYFEIGKLRIDRNICTRGVREFPIPG